MLLGIRWWSLRAKIIAWSFIPAAFILAAVAWVAFASYQQVTEDLVIERNQELIRSSADRFSAQLSAYTRLLTEYAGVLASLPRSAYAYEGDSIVQRDVLARARSRFAVFDGGVIVLDNQGVVVATEPERPEILGQDWSDRPYYRHMLRSPGPVFSDVAADGPQWAEVIVAAVPVKGDQGQFLGVIAGMFRLGETAANPFCNDIARLCTEHSGSSYLVDSAGRVIYHSDPVRIGDDFYAQAAAQQVLAGETGALRAHDLLGRDIVASFAPVPGTSWGTLLIGSRGYQRFLAVLLVLGVAVPALVVSIGVRRITRPIHDLIAAAQGVAGGNFGQAITARTGDEIEELANQFNRMAAELQASYTHLEQRVADRTRELEALNAISAVVSQSLDLDEVLHDAVDKTLQVMGVEGGGIYLLDQENGVLNIAAHQGLEPELVATIDGLKVGEGFSGRVVQSGEPLVVGDISTDPRLSRLEAQGEAGYSLASVPLTSKGEALGTLFIVTGSIREFSDHDVQFLSSIGHQIGIAVENAQHLIQAESRMLELEALYRADERMYRHLRLDEVLQALVDVAVDILNADKSAVLTWDEGRKVWAISVARGFRPETVADLYFAREEGITGRVAATGQAVAVADSLADILRKGERTEALQAVDAEGIRSFMHLPIQLDDEFFGIFNVSFTKPHAFGRDELRLFSSLAQRAALAIDNAQLYEQTQELAVIEERSRLARELHDAVTQTLFSASLIAEVLPELWETDPDEGRELLDELKQLSRGALAEMRTLLLELRPAALVEANLADLLRQLAEAVTGREGVPVEVTIEGQCRLEPDVHVALYRIAQEALNNVVKHAQAGRVEVSLTCAPRDPSEWGSSKEGLQGEQVELCIYDDGRGFDPSDVPPDRLGLGIIRERAQAIGAALQIDTLPGRGTVVRVHISSIRLPSRILS
jgi:nitrate/nitrite-specific signal transduction histidine kinase